MPDVYSSGDRMNTSSMNVYIPLCYKIDASALENTSIMLPYSVILAWFKVPVLFNLPSNLIQRISCLYIGPVVKSYIIYNILITHWHDFACCLEFVWVELLFFGKTLFFLAENWGIWRWGKWWHQKGGKAWHLKDHGDKVGALATTSRLMSKPSPHGEPKVTIQLCEWWAAVCPGQGHTVGYGWGGISDFSELGNVQTTQKALDWSSSQCFLGGLDIFQLWKIRLKQKNIDTADNLWLLVMEHCCSNS